MTETELETEPATEPNDDDLEPDEDEDDDDDATAPTPETTETEGEALLPAAQTEKEIEKRRDQLNREAERHAKRITEILGEDSLGLIQCEACPTNTPGFHYPAADFPADSPERRLYQFLSGGENNERKQPDYFQRCDECNGWGTLDTGAQPTLVTASHPCGVCGTNGYLDTRAPQPAPVVTAAPVNGAELAPVTDPASLDDMWGRPFGHPRHGKFPIYLTPAERAEDIAAGFNVG